MARASTRYRLIGPKALWVSPLVWVATLVEGLLAQTATTAQVASVWLFQVQDRKTRRIVYEVKSSMGFNFDATLSFLRKDLANLTVEEFERQYSIASVPSQLRLSAQAGRKRTLPRLVGAAVRLLLYILWPSRDVRRRASKPQDVPEPE